MSRRSKTFWKWGAFYPRRPWGIYPCFYLIKSDYCNAHRRPASYFQIAQNADSSLYTYKNILYIIATILVFCQPQPHKISKFSTGSNNQVLTSLFFHPALLFLLVVSLINVINVKGLIQNPGSHHCAVLEGYNCISYLTLKSILHSKQFFFWHLPNVWEMQLSFFH